MKIHITEALRVKNDISSQVKELEFKAKSSIVMGNIYEDGIKLAEGEGVGFSETIKKLETALQFSEEINGKLAEFNRLNKVDDLIRQKHNVKLLKEVYEILLPKTKQTTSNAWIAVGDTRKQVVREYKPLHNSKEIKEKINQYKKSIREIQTQVENLNREVIELTFDYQDIDNLGLD